MTREHNAHAGKYYKCGAVQIYQAGRVKLCNQKLQRLSVSSGLFCEHRLLTTNDALRKPWFQALTQPLAIGHANTMRYNFSNTCINHAPHLAQSGDKIK